MGHDNDGGGYSFLKTVLAKELPAVWKVAL
jgi:hypothetical protein